MRPRITSASDNAAAWSLRIACVHGVSASRMASAPSGGPSPARSTASFTSASTSRSARGLPGSPRSSRRSPSHVAQRILRRLCSSSMIADLRCLLSGESRGLEASQGSGGTAHVLPASSCPAVEFFGVGDWRGSLVEAFSAVLLGKRRGLRAHLPADASHQQKTLPARAQLAHSAPQVPQIMPQSPGLPQDERSCPAAAPSDRHRGLDGDPRVPKDGLCRCVPR